MNSIRVQEEIERKRVEERRIGALQIMQQIQENEQVSTTDSFQLKMFCAELGFQLSPTTAPEPLWNVY